MTFDAAYHSFIPSALWLLLILHLTGSSSASALTDANQINTSPFETTESSFGSMKPRNVETINSLDKKDKVEDCELGREMRDICERCSKATRSRDIYSKCCYDQGNSRDFCQKLLAFRPDFGRNRKRRGFHPSTLTRIVTTSNSSPSKFRTRWQRV